MRSDNHTRKQACGSKALACIKFATREMLNLKDEGARGSFCATSVLQVIPCWTSANKIA